MSSVLAENDLPVLGFELRKFLIRRNRTDVGKRDNVKMVRFCRQLRAIISHDYDINFGLMIRDQSAEAVAKERMLNDLCEKCFEVIGAPTLKCSLNHVDCTDCTGHIVYTEKGWKMVAPGRGNLCSIYAAIKGETNER